MFYQSKRYALDFHLYKNEYISLYITYNSIFKPVDIVLSQSYDFCTLLECSFQVQCHGNKKSEDGLHVLNKFCRNNAQKSFQIEKSLTYHGWNIPDFMLCNIL